ncbi:MAG: lysine--tRNA ligase, partial [Synergistaceae bacterium]|nr:lysine--tRNA ligase [Synergistaceae bacterium]
MSDEIIGSADMNEVPEEEIFRQRKAKLERLRSEEGYDPYVNDHWDRTHTLEQARGEFGHLGPEESLDKTVSVAGRVMRLRRHGKAAFADLMDESGTLQMYFQRDELGEKEYAFFKKWVDSGDIVGVKGTPFRTRLGELSIKVKESVLLSKALRALP